MKTAVFAYSRQGCATARKISENFADAQLCRFAAARLEQTDFSPIPKPSGDFYAKQFSRCDALIFVGSCGIAVRQIAPYVRDKRTDPAVLVVDELGTIVISLLSGHIGGANALAKQLAETLGATPVVTTATDINGRFSVDEWAAKKGFVIGDIRTAKAISAAILEGDVPLFSDFPVVSSYPLGVVPGERGQIGIYIGYRKKEPFSQTLQIIPPVLHLGIGCRRGVAQDAIRQAVWDVLEENQIDKRAIRFAASIDLKANEPGLIEFARENNWTFQCYSANQLMKAEGNFSASSFVRSVTGVDTVCERAAILGADRLIVKKTAKNGVTVALAEENLEVSFVG